MQKEQREKSQEKRAERNGEKEKTREKREERKGEREKSREKRDEAEAEGEGKGRDEAGGEDEDLRPHMSSSHYFVTCGV